eukprot:CAMPEP_0206448624 /NCGR_PEP_ID=MMETSP0324_2-20121206/17584_1 /ASSEMBLY_ACC=CAM_ASM_000836 /TAXON_ID=2866 /ORGANISM="Crypthecodinium cohnii, Strain Seligo" /LENGTH=361 /DNA_ID=CAMNT_0053917805 /DNA_START=93 /DNA_END=1178 /DNA_ORIENTATION=+
MAPICLRSLRVPIVQAPMAGGITTPALVAAVADAGGIGAFGFAYSTREKISADLKATENLRTQISGSRKIGAVNANFFVYPEGGIPRPSKDTTTKALAALATQPGGQSASEPQPPYFMDLNDQLEAVWEQPPDLLTFHFGIPHRSIIERAKSLGILVGVSATSPAEAQEIAAGGADFVVAQGFEAGGHRGIFNENGPDEQLPTLELVRRLKEHIQLPIFAAGGIMDGKDIADALAAGAVAAQMGTAFLTCAESGTGRPHREYLASPEIAKRGTTITRGFSGRPARGIVNKFIEAMANQPVMPFPLQNTATGQLRKEAGARGDAEYQSLWAGTNFAKCRSLPAAELIHTLMAELQEARGARL